MLRSFFIALSSNKPFRRFSERSALGRRVSQRFVAGMDSRNRYYGPGVWGEDAKLAKNIKLHEHYGLDLSATFINVFNHANTYLNLGGANDVSSYSNTLAYKGGNRNTELEARFEF